MMSRPWLVVKEEKGQVHVEVWERTRIVRWDEAKDFAVDLSMVPTSSLPCPPKVLLTSKTSTEQELSTRSRSRSRSPRVPRR